MTNILPSLVAEAISKLPDDKQQIILDNADKAMDAIVQDVLNDFGTDSFTVRLDQVMATKDTTLVRLTATHILTRETSPGYGVPEVRKYVAEGEARRDPHDRRDTMTGVLLALGRAMEKLTERIMREAEGRVRHNDDMKADRARRREENSKKKPVPAKKTATSSKVKKAPAKKTATKATAGKT